MASRSFADELVTRYRKPYSLLSFFRNNHRHDIRTNEQLRQWVSSNHDYLTSLDFASFQQLPSISPLWGYDESYYRKEIACELLRITQLAGRRLTPEEASLYLQHASKSIVAQSYDRPAVIAGTLFVAYRGRWFHEFPFRLLSSRTFDPYIFPNVGPPLLKGSFAWTSWHGARLVAHFGMGFLVCHLLAPFYRHVFHSKAPELLTIEPRLGSLASDVQKRRERIGLRT